MQRSISSGFSHICPRWLCKPARNPFSPANSPIRLKVWHIVRNAASVRVSGGRREGENTTSRSAPNDARNSMAFRINGTRFGPSEGGTDIDFSASVRAVPMPLVAHELGQWAVYPSFDEIASYTGVLKARNLEVFRDQLAARGMADQAADFQHASGKFSWSVYKEDMEAALRTP